MECGPAPPLPWWGNSFPSPELLRLSDGEKETFHQLAHLPNGAPWWKPGTWNHTRVSHVCGNLDATSRTKDQKRSSQDLTCACLKGAHCRLNPAAYGYWSHSSKRKLPVTATSAPGPHPGLSQQAAEELANQRLWIRSPDTGWPIGVDLLGAGRGLDVQSRPGSG